MQIRRWFVGAIVGTLVVLVFVPAATQAALGAPEVTSVTPNEFGSGGNFKILIHGRNFEEVTEIHVGTVSPTKIITTGTPTKGQCKVKSPTEIECLTTFHECGHFDVTVTNPLGTSATTAADKITITCEIYRNEVAVGAAKVPTLGYGQIELESPQIETTFECVNIGFGAGWNIADETGKPIYDHAEILVWSASGHTPTAEHAELSSRCRFIYHGGVEESQPTSPVAWASAEPPLHLVNQEGIVCAETTKKELSSCPAEAERIHETLTREVSREGLSLPWNIQFTEKAGAQHLRIGLPEECKGKTGAERTELSKCPEASEREPGKGPEGCDIPPTPDPPGCVKVQMLSNPPLNLHMVYEGFVEPLNVNAGPNGLTPSSWEFEGHAKGEPSLHLRETPSTEGSTTGSVKILGFSGQELLTVR
jgi:hypothetical protein